MRKTISLIFILAVSLTVPISSTFVSASETRYVDLKDTHWAAEAVEAMSLRGIIAGYPDQSFRPGNEVTYGEFIKMAFIAGTGQDFGNAETENWAENYYNAALSQNYFTANDIAKYQLGRKIPRGDMALIASAVIGRGEAVSNYDEISSKITDVKYNTKHEYDIIRAYSNGILTGYPDDTFRPDDTLTRAEAAVVIKRLVSQREQNLLEEDPQDEEIEEDETAEEEATRIEDKKPKSTLERLRAGDESEFANWAKTSQSRKPLTEVMDNKDQMPALENVKYYEIVNDFPHTFSFEMDLLGGELMKASNLDNSRGAILIKSRTGILLGCTEQYYYVANAGYDSPFPKDFDYIGFYNGGLDVMMLVPNPL